MTIQKIKISKLTHSRPVTIFIMHSHTHAQIHELHEEQQLEESPFQGLKLTKRSTFDSAGMQASQPSEETSKASVVTKNVPLAYWVW